MIDNYLSQKMRALSTIAILMVVTLHTANLALMQAGPGDRLVEFSQVFIGMNFCRAGVPLFITVSAFLFFANYGQPAPGATLRERAGAAAPWFAGKAKKRLRTLAIPFLLWSAVSFAAVAAMQSVPAARPYFNGQLLAELPAAGLLRKLLWDPVGYQLWFLRDLCIMVLVSPLLLLLHRCLRWGLAALALAVYMGLAPLRITLVSPDMLFFFIVGMCMALSPAAIPARRSPAWLSCALLGAWLGLSAARAAAEMWPADAAAFAWIKYSHIRIAGLAALWTAYDLWGARGKAQPRWMAAVASQSFFLYAAHEPTLSIIKKLTYKALGPEPWAIAAGFLLTLGLTLCVCIGAGKLFKRRAPRLYALATGGR